MPNKARTMDPSSPEWNGYSEGGWEQQRWFGETDDKGQPVADPTVFRFADVDGMFGPGGFQNRYCGLHCPASFGHVLPAS